jgi:hypothetical protein
MPAMIQVRQGFCLPNILPMSLPHTSSHSSLSQSPHVGKTAPQIHLYLVVEAKNKYKKIEIHPQQDKYEGENERNIWIKEGGA